MPPDHHVDTPLAARFTEVVGPEHVVTDVRELRLYRGGPWGMGDSTGRFGRTPSLAIRPGHAAEVARCMRLAAEAGRPIVALGGRTGLSGAGLPSADAVVIDLARLNVIEAIEAPSRRARVGASVLLGELATEADRAGLLFAHDPWSQPLASVGGAIATNGVGYLAAGYGPMGAQVLGVQVALTTGELLALSSAVTTSTGPDLSRLFVGSEGTLGVITAATVKLFPRPERWFLRAHRFPSFANGFRAIQAAQALDLRLAMVDYEEDDDGPTATLHSAVAGPTGVAEAVSSRWETIVAENGGSVLDASTAQEFWDSRHDSARSYAVELTRYRAEAAEIEDDANPVGRPRRGWRYLHLALPAGLVLDVHRTARDRAAARGVEVRSAGIWGWPELFSLVLTGPATATNEIADELCLLASSVGGSVEYCHGVGLRLAHLMPRALGPALPVLTRIKRALDPSGALNPGKQGIPEWRGES